MVSLQINNYATITIAVAQVRIPTWCGCDLSISIYI